MRPEQTTGGIRSSLRHAASVGRFSLGWSWLMALLCGLALRLFQIGDQILADDEWHAVHALLYRNYSFLFSHFGGADYCIPLTVLYKWLGNHIGLSEMTMRAPMLVFGVGAVFVLPLLVREEIGAPASRVFAWLLAISPIHIYYSRYARPYSITLFLAFLGIIAFFKWWSNGRTLERELPGRPSVDVTPWLSEYTQVYGPPVYTDEDITVFDVAAQAEPTGAPLTSQR